MKLTARSRLETYASLSRTQSDEQTYGMRTLDVDSGIACPDVAAGGSGIMAAGELSERRRTVEVTTINPSGYLVQMTTERNPPHGWAVHLLHGEHVDGAIPFYLDDVVEALKKECERAWREVDFIAKERTEHLEWRTKLANDLDEVERMRDVLARTVNMLKSKGDMLAAVVHGAKEEFVRVPYGASHEDVAAINDWHRMADEALKEWK